MLKRRIITALILIPLVFAVLFSFSPLYFNLTIALIMLYGAWEWSCLMGLLRVRNRWFYLALMAILAGGVFFIPPLIFFGLIFLWWLTAIVLIILYPNGSQYWGRGVIWRGLMGFLVLIPCWYGLVFIRAQEEGLVALVFLFLLIWGADTTAYFMGKRFGKRKLAFQVSPGKSLLGVAAACSFAVLFSLFVLWIGHVDFDKLFWGVALAVLTVIFSIIGDLFESMIKRQAGVKDSGQLLPGHGGLLDRVDSLTAAVPIFIWGALLLSYT